MDCTTGQAHRIGGRKGGLSAQQTTGQKSQWRSNGCRGHESAYYANWVCDCGPVSFHTNTHLTLRTYEISINEASKTCAGAIGVAKV